MAFVALGLWFYTKASAYHVAELHAELKIALPSGPLAVRTADVLVWLAAAYAIILVPYYALFSSSASSGRIAARWLVGQFFFDERPAWRREEQQAALALALKLFFVPLMVNALIANTSDVLVHAKGFASWGDMRPMALFDAHLYPLLFSALLLVDVTVFAIGYVVELPALRNEIQSVDPTAAGWIVCLACYPPFNQAFSAFFPSRAVDFPRFNDAALHVSANCAGLVAMAVYAWASLALGARASNLTNRGIVASGPYAWVRHPAYTAKNLAWWIGAMPAVAAAFNQSWSAGLWSLACVAAWTAIYIARALTEERHLLMLPNGYAEYQRTVPFRFLPKIC
ncbi:MAG: DUF1295 domain-containing protein [Betaproteobacteria bacterium]|nr:DUF1295 domain-containing protein [Betaproteobacteria bacterium]